jgi:hypothetical protein
MGTLTVPDTDGQSEREPRRDYEPGTQARGCQASTACPEHRGAEADLRQFGFVTTLKA